MSIFTSSSANRDSLLHSKPRGLIEDFVLISKCRLAPTTLLKVANSRVFSSMFARNCSEPRDTDGVVAWR